VGFFVKVDFVEVGVWFWQTLDFRSDVALPPFPEPVAEKVIEFGFGFDGLDRFFNVVGDSAKLDLVFIEDDIAAARIPISGLSDAADIDHQP
jgi:hypothetical protein